jgi:hypothetical protein
MTASEPESTPQPAVADSLDEALGEPSPGSAEVVPLIVKAIGTLPPAERDQVYVWLLSRPRLHQVTSLLQSLQIAGGSPGSQQIGQQMVPVRFAADQHAQLRAWCADHGFSMATVIRGLVARFLEGQLPAGS